MKIAVTSASGQLGAAIVLQLIKDIGKDQVIGIARTPAKASALGVEIRPGDYNNRPQLDEALKGVDAVLLVSGMDDPQKRIQQHRNVIDAAKLNGVQKIVYTSIIGDENKTAFSPVIKSNRNTEKDIRDSGMAWSIGRNGIYIEPDLEYLDNYIEAGEITNCAGTGKCAYTSREELARAYAQMLINDVHNSQTYNLVGEPISQDQLAEVINEVYQTELTYHPISVEEYEAERKQELGDFLGTIIAGIYEGIRNGANEVPSDFSKAAGTPHQSPKAMVESFKKQQNK
ncbi:NAD(P)-dependent oxidoreductase [Echinicola pacifica]|uniref:NAD(P)-dependent oxidoreductase n=1 Tax=Echinicola pacifica TaxID=346377 RepID=A0A918PXQ7_9BACT|nr:SDR family oxidoreductase [Echinicola pacifica]GGZ25655.1 NAD(P)-dependent oxidoreductase [Echinicola pacifica]